MYLKFKQGQKKNSTEKGDINHICRDGGSFVEKAVFGLGIEEVEFLYTEVLRLKIRVGNSQETHKNQKSQRRKKDALCVAKSK